MSKKGYKSVPWLFGKEIEIPEEWEVKKIDDIFDFLISGTNARSDLNDSSEIRYIHYGDIHTEWKIQLDCDLEKIPRIDIEKVSRLPLLKEGDLIIADASEDVEGSGTSILLKNVKNKKIVAGLHTLVLRRKNENISFNFMKYLTSISHVKIQITSWVTGAKVFGLTKKSCKEIRIPLPTLPEQQKIATILSNVDSLIESTSKIIENSKSLKTGLMQKLLTRGIGHTKFKKVHWIFGKEIEIPDEWEIKKIKDITKVSVGLVINPSIYFDDNGTIPMITGKHITENGIVLDDVDFITEKSNNLLETTRIWSNDLVTMRVGYPGRTNVVKNEHDGINCASLIITRRSKKFMSEFLGYLINSKLIIKQIIMHQAGGVQQVINTGSWKEFVIPFPSILEQQKITSILSNIDAQIDSQIQYKDKLERLKKSLMQKLLTGEIRVKV